MVTADKLDELRLEPEVPELDLSWLNLDTEWGVAAAPGRKGLTLQQINKTLYGDVPASSEDSSARPRGAAPPAGATPRMTPWVLGDATETFSGLRRAALRRGRLAAVVVGDRHPLGHDGRAA